LCNSASELQNCSYKHNEMLIDFEIILEIAMLGIRRAAVFLGFGLNAALDPNFRDYRLAPHTGFSFVPENASDVDVDEYKREFATWITANGLREIIESFAIFLDAIYTTCLKISMAKNILTTEEAEEKNRAFKQLFIQKKLKRLAAEYSIRCEVESLLQELSIVRNCLTHRRGIVSHADCNDNAELRLSWKGLDIAVLQPDGKSLPIPFPVREEVIVEQGGTITATFVERTVAFPEGSVIYLNPKDLAEIAFSICNEAKQVVTVTIDFARSMGIEIVEKQNNEAQPANNSLGAD